MGEKRQGVLLTGATGFLGGEVLARLLERDERPVYALIRADDDEGAAKRLRGVVKSLLGSDEESERAIAVAGDVTRPRLGMSDRRRDWVAERVDSVIPCAASVSSTLGLDESREINVDGPRRVLGLAHYAAARGGLDS